jgi:hypothetical protein
VPKFAARQLQFFHGDPNMANICWQNVLRSAMLVLMNVKNIPRWNTVSGVRRNAGIVQKNAVRWHKPQRGMHRQKIISRLILFHAKAQSLLRRKEFLCVLLFLVSLLGPALSIFTAV